MMESTAGRAPAAPPARGKPVTAAAAPPWPKKFKKIVYCTMCRYHPGKPLSSLRRTGDFLEITQLTVVT